MRTQKMAQEQVVWLRQPRKNGLAVHSIHEIGPCGYVLHCELMAASADNTQIAPQ